MDLITDIAYQGYLPIEARYGNGLSSSSNRNQLGRVDQWRVSDTGNDDLLNRQITYTPIGYHSTVTNENEDVTNYFYDSAYRVIEEETVNSDGSTKEKITYDYDDANNRTAVTFQLGESPPETKDYSVDELNSYTKIGSQVLTLDANRNLTDDGTFRYSYDAFNRLVEVRDQEGNLLIQYTYDAYDRRIQRIKTEADGTPVSNHRYIYDGGNLIEVWDADSDELVTRYTYLDGQLISKTDSTGTYYIHTDPQGHVVAVTNETSEVTTKQSIDAFGNRTVEQGEPFEFGYQSWCVDPTTGFSFVNGRDYNPKTRRTIQNSMVNPVIGSQPQLHFLYSAGGLFSLTAPVPIPIEVNPLDPRARLDNFMSSRTTDAINPPGLSLPRRTYTAPRPHPRFDDDDDFDDDDRPARPTYFRPPGYSDRPVVSSILKEVGSALVIDFNFYNPIEPEIPRLPIRNNLAFSADLITERFPIENNFAFSADLISNDPLLSLAELAFISITEYNFENPPELVLRPVVYRPVVRKPKYVKSILGDVRSSLVIP